MSPCITFKIIATSMLYLCICNVGAQSYNNLVPNPSFEKYDTCPNNIFGIKHVIDWFSPCNSPVEYYNTCASGTPFGVPNNDWGSQYPMFGNGYTQITVVTYLLEKREYIGAKLFTPLKAGTTYCGEFYVSLTENLSPVACDQIGLLLTDSLIICPPSQDPGLSSFKPQITSPKGIIITDTINWTLISGSYIAKGGEQFLTIGVFVVNDSLNTSILYPSSVYHCEYYIDNVYIYECENEPIPANAGTDIVLCPGDSFQLGTTNYLDYKYHWTNSEGFSDTLAKPWVHPLHTTTYYLEQMDFKYQVTNDSITVFVDECLKPLVIPNVFTPNSDGKNDNLEILNPGNHAYKITIFNRWGKIVFKGDETKAWDGKKNGNEVPDGVYYYQITAYLKDGREINYTGVVHLMR